MALKTKLRFATVATLLLGSHAMAQDVYSGCEAPVPVANHHTFFIDPVKGTDQGDGSAQRPWRSLDTVLDPTSQLLATKSHKTVTGSPLVEVNPNAPIKGGDILMLMSGNYGDVVLENAFNDKFITVMPAPGANPIIAHLRVTGASRWLFQNLTFQSENAKPTSVSLAAVADGWGDASKNFVFDHDTFQTAVSTSSWTDQDWYTKPNFAAVDIRAACVAVTNSTLRNLLNGIVTYGQQTLIKNNTIDQFSTDGIDAVVGKLSIIGNTITNGRHNASSASHPDVIQVWSPYANGKITTVSSDILIDSNKVFTPKGTAASGLQGISAASCNNVTMQNNVVVVNHWNGMTASALTNSRIINNTVMSSDPSAHPSYLTIQPNAYGASKGVVVRNNVSSYIYFNDSSILADHNAVNHAYTVLQDGKPVWHTQSDAPSQNLVLPTLEAGFRNWDPSQEDFDLHLKTASVLIGKGSSSSAPVIDADGRTRSDPMDLGAFSH